MRVLLLLVLLAAVARADVVVIGRREIRGEIVEETPDHVKIKVGDGVITIPRKQVKEIRREDEVATLVGEARTLAKTLDAKALDVFDRAIAAARKKGQGERADELQKERNDYATKIEKQVTRETRGAAEATGDEKTAPDDLFLLEADLEEVRVNVNAYKEGDKNAGRNGAGRLTALANRHMVDHEDRWAIGCLALARSIDPEDAKGLWAAERAERLRACGQAVRERDAKIARAAIAPVLQEEPSDARVDYLAGRAEEVARSPVAARDDFEKALDGTSVPNLVDLPVDWLRELARRRAAGQSVGPGSPGFGDEWRQESSPHFVVYHELGDDFDPREPDAFENARAASLLRLGLSEADVNEGTKVPMFLFKSREAYIEGGGPEWAGGHVGLVTLEDGEARTIYTYPGRRLETATMQHELAHVLVGEAYPKLILPGWAEEGVACYAEPDATRAARRMEAGRALAAGKLVALGTFLERASIPQGGDRDAIGAFYAESSVVFSALVAKAGSIKEALTVAARIARKGADAGLRELGTDTATFEGEIKADLTPGK